MAVDAAFLLVVKATGADHLRIVKRSIEADIVAGVAFNGVVPLPVKQPKYQRSSGGLTFWNCVSSSRS